jgi:hypothetical protein
VKNWDTPILIVSARTDKADKLNGFDLALMRQYLLNASADDRNLILDSSVDMNADNEFNIQDVVTMTKFLLGE